eukprot:781143-Prorocentrum_minimum.AAC.1
MTATRPLALLGFLLLTTCPLYASSVPVYCDRDLMDGYPTPSASATPTNSSVNIPKFNSESVVVRVTPHPDTSWGIDEVRTHIPPLPGLNSESTTHVTDLTGEEPVIELEVNASVAQALDPPPSNATPAPEPPKRRSLFDVLHWKTTPSSKKGKTVATSSSTSASSAATVTPADAMAKEKGKAPAEPSTYE